MSPLPPPSRPRPGGIPNRPAPPVAPTTPIYVAVDVEATANERNNEIIEVAAVTFTSERILERWSSLVRPIRAVPLGTAQLTGITNAMLQAAPPFRECCATACAASCSATRSSGSRSSSI